jgi:hypothetical protein
MSGPKIPGENTGEKFRLPASSYETVCRIVHAYAEIGRKPAKLDDVVTRAGATRAMVASNHGFLSSISIVTGGRVKAVTDTGYDLGVAISHNDPETIAAAWRKVIDGVEFFDKVLSAIRIRRGMTKEDLASHIAITAGEPKDAATMTGARTVIEVLQKANLIKEQDGVLVADIPSLIPIETTATKEGATQQIEQPWLLLHKREATSASAPFVPAPRIQVNIALNLNIDATNLEATLQRIDQFIKSHEEDKSGE